MPKPASAFDALAAFATMFGAAFVGILIGVIVWFAVSAHGIQKFGCRHEINAAQLFALNILNSVTLGLPGIVLAATTPRMARHVR